MFKRNLPGITPHEKLIVTKEWNEKFIDSLNNNDYSKSDTDLGMQRDKFCKQQAKEFKLLSRTSSVLKRVIIWEEVSDEDIDNEILSLLNKKFKVPQSQTEDTYLNLLEVIKKGRDNHINVLPLCKQIINEKAVGRPLLDSNYKTRKEEYQLIAHLERYNVLLLTGISLCGKTELAKRVSLHFFEKGFNYKISDDIPEISHFFSLSPLEDKIAILEDPWGHSQPEEGSLDRWRKLEQLISNLSRNHKLIVTSRIEIIQEIHSFKPLQKCKLKQYDWIDLTITNRETLIGFWNDFAKENVLPKGIVEKIEKNIQSQEIESLLQIGQLQYIANTEIEDLKNKNIDELEHLARQNSQDISENLKLKKPDIAEVLTVLALCATPIYSISITDLSFIFSDDDKEYSIIEKELWSSSTRDEKITFPAYEKTHRLKKEIEKCLEYLEHRHFITIKNNNVIFTHPNYYEAGRCLFFTSSSLQQRRFFYYLKKILSCLSPQNVFLATKQFSFLINNNTDSDYQHKTNELAFYGMNSIFPAVEDSILVFLIANIERLPEDQREKVVQKLDSADTPTSHVFWYKDEIPFISTEGSFSFFNPYFTLDEKNLENIEMQFKTGNSVKPYDAWNYVISFQNTPSKKIKKEIAKFLLQYNEVFIRKRVALLFLSRSVDDDNTDLVKQIFLDDHPSVIFNAIRGAFLSWKTHSKEIKEFLFSLIKAALGQEAIAIRSNQLMTTFAKEHQSESMNWEVLNQEEKTELWNVWGELYPVFVKHLPPNVFINTGRFGMTMDEALKFLTLDKGMKVLSAWYDRIDYKISSGYFLDEYELAIADNLLAFTGKNFEIRKSLFDQLINYLDTNFILSSLKWTVEYWEDLDQTEKDKILILIRSKREDIRGLRQFY